MSKRSSQLLLEDIIDCANKILAYTKGLSFEQFVADSKPVDAVIRNFEVIGEAANRLPEDYMGIDYKIVWLVKEGFLPDLISKLTNLLPD